MRVDHVLVLTTLVLENPHRITRTHRSSEEAEIQLIEELIDSVVVVVASNVDRAKLLHVAKHEQHDLPFALSALYIILLVGLRSSTLPSSVLPNTLGSAVGCRCLLLYGMTFLRGVCVQGPSGDQARQYVRLVRIQSSHIDITIDFLIVADFIIVHVMHSVVLFRAFVIFSVDFAF
jgi:hypothetical protein